MNNMQVGFINSRINFNGDNDNVIAYDDSVSKQRREFIREHYNSWHTPTIDIYEKEPQQTEYGLQKIITTLLGKPKNVDDRLLPKDYCIRKDYSQKNLYRGMSLGEAPICVLKELKKAGIKTVVDLSGYGGYKERVKSVGMDYFEYILPYNKHMLISEAFNEYNKDDTKREFINFIKKMQEDYIYIACQFGTYVTEDALLLNNFFNPKAGKLNYFGRKSVKARLINEFYNIMTPEDLKQLGWDKEFRLKFLSRLKKFTK